MAHDEHDCIQLLITETESGTILIATNEAPFFCFEAKDEEAAIKVAKRAISFFIRSRQPEVRTIRSAAARGVTHVRPRWTRAEECVAVA